jgi:hypothetical protein
LNVVVSDALAAIGRAAAVLKIWIVRLDAA